MPEWYLVFGLVADSARENQQEKAESISSFKNTGITLDTDKTTINGQKLDEYTSGEYSPYSVDDLLDEDADSDEKEYDRVQEYRFHAPTGLGEKIRIDIR